MGDFDGRMRDLDRRIQQLRAHSGEPSNPGGCVRAWVSPAAGATDLRDHVAAKEDRIRKRDHAPGPEPRLVAGLRLSPALDSQVLRFPADECPQTRIVSFRKV